jgi:selenium metabolism protein YedF
MSESTRRIDARGLSCPQPVILTKKALEEGGFELLEVLVNSESSRENVARFATHGGHQVEAIASAPGETKIRIKPTRAAGGAGASSTGSSTAAPIEESACDETEVPAAAQQPAAATASGARTATFLIASAAIGSGSEELGELLMKGFVATLLETSPLPERIILMNGGVKLAVTGSPSLDKLAALANRGVEILACGTCLDYFKLKDSLAVGRVTNMFEIAGFLAQGTVLSL